MAIRIRFRMGAALAFCACSLVFVLVFAGQPRAAGPTPHFTKLAGAGQSLPEPRSEAVAATLPSGQVLIAGGWSGGDHALRSAVLFDPATDQFTILTGAGRSLVGEREDAVAATLPSGLVLIAGGQGHDLGAFSSAELFNPATRTFVELHGAKQSLRQAREGAVAATLPSGEVLIAGGRNRAPTVEEIYRTAELFNPQTDTFTMLSGTRQSLSTWRVNAVAATLPSGQVLIAGGSDIASPTAERVTLTSAELFNPRTDTFSQLTGVGRSLNEAREGAVAITLLSGQVLIAGGRVEGKGDLSSAELFDPDTDTFAKLTGTSGSLTIPRTGAVAARLRSGDVLLAGGWDEGNAAPEGSAELFVPAESSSAAPKREPTSSWPPLKP